MTYDKECASSKLHAVFYESLKYLILKRPEVAYTQLLLAFDNNIFMQSEYNSLFQCCRMKGDADLILTLLFLSSNLCSFRIVDKEFKIYNILENPITTMKDAHFKLYLEYALDKVKKDNQRKCHFGKKDQEIKAIKKE